VRECEREELLGVFSILGEEREREREREREKEPCSSSKIV